jgi:hypothetical protein
MGSPDLIQVVPATFGNSTRLLVTQGPLMEVASFLPLKGAGVGIGKHHAHFYLSQTRPTLPPEP